MYMKRCLTDNLSEVGEQTEQLVQLVHSLDIKTAFLQLKQIERNFFLLPPKEANNLWHLKKCIYGLVHASRY